MKIPIRKEGIGFYGISLILTFLMFFFHIFFALIFAILTIFFLWFFRDPERQIPQEGVLCPADGKIIEIEEREGENFIAIFMSPFNVHINRAPIKGKITRVEYKFGEKYPAHKKDASLKNESNTFTIEGEKFSLRVKQIAGIFARRIVSFKKEGEEVERGERIGLIKFGSRVEVFLPKDLRILIRKGERVYGGITIIAKEEKTP